MVNAKRSCSTATHGRELRRPEVMRFDLFVAFQEESIATGDRQPESMYLFRGGQVRPCDAGVHTALVLFGAWCSLRYRRERTVSLRHRRLAGERCR